MNAPSIYEAFNARSWTEVEVAERFVPSEQYNSLVSRNHALVIGPRGSGKTSLLKMLQVKALSAWRSEHADGYRAHVDFVGIFIPTDIQWFKFLQEVESSADGEIGEYIIQSLITEKVLLAFLDSWESRLNEDDELGFLALEDSHEKEQKVCAFLSDILGLVEADSYIDSIRAAIVLRSVHCRKLIKSTLYLDGGFNQDRLSEFRDFFFLDFMSYLPAILETFNRSYEDTDRMWALCFDELELAPQFLQEDLLEYIRSTSKLIIFKLSMSPFCATASRLRGSERDASEKEDFEVIPLWYHEKRASEKFTKELVSDLLNRHFKKSFSVEEVFGLTPFSDDQVDYLKDPARLGVLSHAYKNDPGFQEYCDNKGIRVDSLEDLSPTQRASYIRKGFPTVAFRDYYGLDQKGRSRKKHELYTGWGAFCAIFEGNPRWIIGCMSELVKAIGSNSEGSEDAVLIDTSVQSKIIEAARHRFRAKLKTVMVGASYNEKNLMDLVDTIGGKIESYVYERTFIPEPVQSFTLDEKTAETHFDLIADGLSSGAFVFCPDSAGKELITGLAGKRFRISYLLATEYKIPLRKGSNQALGLLLSDRTKDRRLVGDSTQTSFEF
ncbi:hypothetical protein QEH59_00015 [Coraliomargarita sp. SDUM461004]|uniref:AAA+ ATPase domain-containing protein n=1 Tax=Thalassobacterium sedimentorum TaxID=3041258 RepID=A0ABU1AGA1_9BACT|nr:hypothetical protein [Coraliomargarita sp. SDUM461004]MDQ8192786.1 hypothetical protein [Coraliomargarita sp. SDUM461004]